MRILLADDEPLARQFLRDLLEEAGAGPIVGEAGSGLETLEQVVALRPDALFLDIQMPGMSGLQVAALLQHRPDCPRVVFVTAYDEFALKAFEVEAADYLLKPVTPERLNGTLTRLARPASCLPQVLASLDGPKRLVVIEEKNGGRQLLDPQEVLWISAEGEYTYVQSDRGRWRCSQSLAALESQWRGFFRCHRAYLVNLHRIQAVIPLAGGAYHLQLKGSSHSVPLSRRQAASFKALVGWL